MTSYLIRKGTIVFRFTEPVSGYQKGGTTIVAKRDVVYDEADLIKEAGTDSYYFFRLPQSALPYTQICVYMKDIVIS